MAVSAMPAVAHHSISSAYDSIRNRTLEGVVAEFHFVYPHPFLMVDVQQGQSTTRWTLEMDNRSELARVGMTSQTLRPGDRIIVTGSPARSGQQSLYIRKLERPADGFQYEQIGRSPRIRPAQ
jgi:hypothetical protein